MSCTLSPVAAVLAQANKTATGLVQADDGAFGIARPVVDVQHVFHVGDESGTGLRRNDILLFQMRLSR